MIVWLVSLVLLVVPPLTAASAFAQYRPLVVEEARTAAPGTLEVEPEVAYADVTDGDGEVRTDLQLTYGLTDRIDARVTGRYLFLSPEGRGSVNGVGDTDAGLRILFRQATEPVDLSIALDAALEIPTADADRGLGTGSLDVRLLWIGTLLLPGKTTLDLNAGYTFVDRDTLRGQRLRDAYLYGAAFEKPARVGREGPALRLLAEAFVRRSEVEGEKEEATGGVGLAWDVSEAASVGASVRRRLRSGVGPDVALVVGAEVRY